MQYLAPEHPVPFSDQLKQLVELHRVAELAMKDVIIRLWPAKAILGSYFGLVKRLVDSCPRLDVVKRSESELSRAKKRVEDKEGT